MSGGKKKKKQQSLVADYDSSDSDVMVPKPSKKRKGPIVSFYFDVMTDRLTYRLSVYTFFLYVFILYSALRHRLRRDFAARAVCG